MVEKVPVPMLVISGSMGAGKTAVLGQAHDLLTEARVAHGAIDLDCLTEMYPSQPQYGNGLLFPCTGNAGRNA